jgi:hypothetical protein
MPSKPLRIRIANYRRIRVTNYNQIPQEPTKDDSVAAKKHYETPKLTDYGQLTELTHSSVAVNPADTDFGFLS